MSIRTIQSIVRRRVRSRNLRVESLERRMLLSGSPPRAVADYLDLDGGAVLSLAASAGVLANDTDAENDVLVAAVARQPSFGTLNLQASGALTYTPGASFTQWDSFEYVVNDGTSDGNRAIVTITDGQPVIDDDENPHPGGTVAHDEHEAVFDLMPRYTATHTAIANGNWSSAGTWADGIRPVDHARVLIPAGTTVTVDGQIAATLAIVRVDGGLRFSPAQNTELRAETVLVDGTGSLTMGTAASPIPAGITARLVIADRGEISRTWDPRSLSRGLISHGSVSIYGTAATPFVTLQTAPTMGATQLTLDTAPTNWNVGDQIVIAGTGRNASENNETEVRTILAIAGTTVTIDALAKNHPTPDSAAKVHVAHVTRNAIVESENSALDRRGHVMLMHNPSINIQNAAFNQLGRTNKLVPVKDAVLLADGSLSPGTGTNPRGRYPVHLHRTGALASGVAATISGSVVFDSPGWGFVNHSSYVHFSDNVAYDVNGASFVTEAGDEIGSFRRNIAIHSTGSDAGAEARRNVNDFGHEGDGFWFQGGGVEVEDNVSAAQDKHGFIFFTEGLIQEGGVRARFTSANLADPSIAGASSTIAVGSVPIRLFRGNTAYGTSQGVQTQFHLQTPTHTARSVLEDVLVWNADVAINMPYTKQTNLRNVDLIGNMTSPFDYGINSNEVTENILAENLNVAGFDIGWEIPRRGPNSISNGSFNNVVNFELIKVREEPRSFTTAGDLDLRMLAAPAGMTAANFRVEQSFVDDGGYAHVFRPETITLTHNDCTGQRIYSAQQAASFVPFPAALAGLTPGYVGKTNQQLWDEFGLAVGGQIAPAGATTAPGVVGLFNPPLCGLNAPVAMDNTYMLWQSVSWSESSTTGVLSNDYDMDGQPLTAMLDTQPANGSVTLNPDGSFTYIPNPTFVGTDTFTYHVFDGTANSSTATVTLTVQPTTPDFVVTVKEVASGRALTTIDLANNVPLFIDADMNPQGELDDNVAAFSASLAGSKILQTAKADRNFGSTDEHEADEAYTRFHANQNATVYVGYHPNLLDLPEWLDQDHGWRATGLELRSFDVSYVLFEQSFTAGDIALGHNVAHHSMSTPPMYTVLVQPHSTDPINNAPFAAKDLFDLAGGLSLVVPAAQGVLANDLDSDGDTLTATVTKTPLFGSVTLGTNGAFTYTPGPNFTRWDSFQYATSDGQETSNATVVTILNGQPLDDPGDPHQGDEVRHDEHVALFELTARHTATHTAVASGNWSSPSTWQNGLRPIDDANVLIPAGLTVTVDGIFGQKLRTLRVDGALRFAPTINTSLSVDTTVVSPSGLFEMGTAASPIAAGASARLVIADRGPIDRVWDPFGLSRGFISHGTTRVHGSLPTAFLPLAVAPRAGDSQLSLAGVPSNWRVGDQIVVAGTSVGAAANNESELRTILAINGGTVTIAPLAFNHLPPPNNFNFQVHVAHVTRNAVIESENVDIAARGHIMFMHNDAVDVNGAGLYHLGRTNKRQPANDSIVVHDGTLVPGRGMNQRGRYAAHFHRTGITNDGTPGLVRGSVVMDSFGWGYVNHSSFVEFTDNVAYDVDGASFVTETGDEIGTFARNIAVHSVGSGAGLEAREDVQDFGHQGDGFWFQGGGVHVVDNVAAAQRAQGFIFFTEGLVQPGLGTTRFLAANLPDPSIAGTSTTISVINTPIFEFRGNTAYGTVDGLHTQYHLLNARPGVRSVLEDFTAWNVTNGHNAPYTKHTDIHNLRLVNDVKTPRSEGFDTNDVTEDIRFYNPTIIGFTDGIEVPQRGNNRIEGGLLYNRNNIEMDKIRFSARSMTIAGDVEFRLIPPPAGGTSYNIQMQQLFTPYNDAFNHVYYPDALYIDNGGGNIQQVWHPEQAPSFVPFPTEQMGLPPEYVGLTNQQLFDYYGVTVAGGLAPADAFTIPGVRGLVTSIPYFVEPPQSFGDLYLAYENSPRTVAAVRGVLANDVDPAMPGLTATLVRGPAHGSVTLAADGSFVYTPTANFTGADTFTYQASNGVYSSTPATVTLMVHPDLGVTIQSVSTNKAYQAVDLTLGAQQYIDRTYTVTRYSDALDGGTLIRTANDDKGVTAATHITLNTAQPTTVYVGFDRRNTVRPAWLSAANGWLATTETLGSSYAAGNPTFIVYAKNFAAGTIVLGGPGQGAPLATGSHYVAVLTAQRSPGDVTGEGVTNRADLAALIRNFGQTTAATRAQGDLNGDGAVNMVDLALLQANLTSAPAAPAPAASVVATSGARATGSASGRLSAAPRTTSRSIASSETSTTGQILTATRGPIRAHRARLHDAALTQGIGEP